MTSLVANIVFLVIGLDVEFGPSLAPLAGGPVVTVAVHVLLLTGLLKRMEWGRKVTVAFLATEVVWSAVELTFVALEGQRWTGAALPLLSVLFGAVALVALVRPAMKRYFFDQEYRAMR